MFWQWFKQYLPRGLYGRAALILILPVLTVQLFVSVVFIQRHFDGVTRAMTSAVAIELRHLQSEANAATTLAQAQSRLLGMATGLEMTAVLPSAFIPAEDQLDFDDLTGNMVISELRQDVPKILRVVLGQGRGVVVWVDTNHGPAEFMFARSRVSASNPHQLLVIMVVMGVLMTTISYFFLRNQLRPIKRMARAAADFGRGRITPFQPTGAVEVRAAGMAFLDMRNRIERHNQSRTMMLSGISHDLRTPLTRLRLGLSMLDGADVQPLVRDVDDMQDLLDGFLSFARDQAGDEIESIRLGDLIDQIVEGAVRADHQIEVMPLDAPETLVRLRPQAIVRAVDNLISNAHRYAGKARLCVSLTDRALRFTVEDDGPGIAAKDREAAMSPFVRLDPARNQDAGTGVGLGLAIVADIARGHGGVLRLDDSADLGGLRADLVIAR